MRHLSRWRSNISRCKAEFLFEHTMVIDLNQGEEVSVKKTKKELDKSKRDFIKKSTLAGAGVAASTIVSGEAIAAASTDDKETRPDKGYQLTPHILEYYKSAAS